MAILAAIAGVVAWYSSRGSAARERALDRACGGDFSAAEPELRLAWERDRSDVAVVEALARGNLAAEDRENAEAFLQRWIELQPDVLEPKKLLYELYRKHKNWEKALAAGSVLQRQTPNDSQLRRSLVGHAFEAGRFETAEILCRELLSEQPNNPGFRTTLAAIRRSRGDASGSVAILDEIVRDHPQFVPALADRAAAYEESGEPQKAIPLLREVLKLDRQRQRSAGYRLSVALERTGQTEAAGKVLHEVRRLQDVSTVEEAIKNQPADPALRVRLGESLLLAGHALDGVRIVQSALEIDPGFVPAHRTLLDYFEKSGQPDRAALHRHYAK